mmetsp:Transcript_28824/g.65960  ORF Transcript_28824/g.65960 Transcript_28824/m.65960 type:complete len:248 (-) Transcript_28824:1049-1792(-)
MFRRAVRSTSSSKAFATPHRIHPIPARTRSHRALPYPPYRREVSPAPGCSRSVADKRPDRSWAPEETFVSPSAAPFWSSREEPRADVARKPTRCPRWCRSAIFSPSRSPEAESGRRRRTVSRAAPRRPLPSRRWCGRRRRWTGSGRERQRRRCLPRRRSAAAGRRPLFVCGGGRPFPSFRRGRVPPARPLLPPCFLPRAPFWRRRRQHSFFFPSSWPFCSSFWPWRPPPFRGFHSRPRILPGRINDK